MEENVHHVMCFILLLHFVHQQTFQSTMTNELPFKCWMATECHQFWPPQCEKRPPGGRAKKRFWTKANLSAYLRSCSCTGKLSDAIYLSAKNGDSDPPFPVAWSNHKVFSKCHYARMHMLFLGHVKSDIDMVSKWLGHYEILATFGKQANLCLDVVQNLRVNRYFTAHPFSTSSWGQVSG